MRHQFYFNYAQQPSSEDEEGLAMNESRQNFYIEGTQADITVADITAKFREFLKAAGFID